ncbi:MAG: tRNA lysidine(34) synthetase TilS [Solirubrobacteraceae bacterium]
MFAEAMCEQVRDEGLLAPGRSVLVMISGGRDSTCLLDLAVRIAGREAVSGLHVNYGLRAEAGRDQRRCAELCGDLQVPLVIHTVTRAPTASGNLQAWAREIRYEAASSLAREAGAEIAAGHTATDQVETILYRLASSPSRRALLGMRSREGHVVRPLLNFTRTQTADYCRARGLEWCEDAGNESPLYARGRIRSALIPALRSVHPAAEANVLALAERLRDEAEFLEASVDAVLDAEEPGTTEISLQRLRALPVALGRLVVQRLADTAAGGPAPGTARRLAEIVALRDHGRASIDLPHGVRAVAVAGRLHFEKTPPVRLPA